MGADRQLADPKQRPVLAWVQKNYMAAEDLDFDLNKLTLVSLSLHHHACVPVLIPQTASTASPLVCVLALNPGSLLRLHHVLRTARNLRQIMAQYSTLSCNCRHHHRYQYGHFRALVVPSVLETLQPLPDQYPCQP